MLHRVAELKTIRELAVNGRLFDALTQCKQQVETQSTDVDAWLLLARLSQQASQFHDMLAAAQQAHALAPLQLAARQQLIEALACCGEIALAKKQLQFFETHLDQQIAAAPERARHWQLLSQLYTHCADHLAAARCAECALACAPTDSALRYNVAAAHFAVGNMAQCVSETEGVLQQTPSDCDAYYLRAVAGTQSAEQNHIAALQDAATKFADAQNSPALFYALGKEYEDLGQMQAAFDAYAIGARQRKQRLRYNFAQDVQTLKQIAEVFSAEVFRHAGKITRTDCNRLFIVGLPRSGSTLIERVLSAHDAIGSLGEINDLAFALLRSCGYAPSKLALIKQSAHADFQRLGDEYLFSTSGYGVGRRCLIDKTPLNYLYLGLIHLVLPQARIIHIKRHPLASCYAMYKTLFRMGYPFSYDFDDLAAYYAAYEQLMQHWRDVIPDAFIDVQYETFVRNSEQESRRLLSYLGLPWQPSCAQFYDNAQPSATASGAQVRKPIYLSSIALHEQLRASLLPLRTALEQRGIVCEP